MSGRVVGRKGRTKPLNETPAVHLWKTDIIDNRDPDFAYQFFREDQVRDKLRADRVELRDFETGDHEVHDVPPWEICRRDVSGEEAAGYRPDEGKPVDNVLRHGAYVAMRIPRDAWDLLQRKQEQVADAYETRLRGGRKEEFDIDGNQTRPGQAARIEPGHIRINEHPLGRI